MPIQPAEQGSGTSVKINGRGWCGRATAHASGEARTSKKAATGTAGGRQSPGVSRVRHRIRPTHVVDGLRCSTVRFLMGIESSHAAAATAQGVQVDTTATIFSNLAPARHTMAAEDDGLGRLESQHVSSVGRSTKRWSSNA